MTSKRLASSPLTERATRRTFLGAAARTGAGLIAGPGLLGLAAKRSEAASLRPIEMHLTFGADPAREMTVSWSAHQAAGRPRLRYGPLGATDLAELNEVETVAVVDRDTRLGLAVTQQRLVHHVRLRGLRPDTAYAYQVVGDDLVAGGTFRTGVSGRRPFRFTAFGDQGTGDLQDVLSGPQGSWIVQQVEAQNPAFNLHLGDLSYAAVNPLPGTRGPAWDRFMANNTPSTRNRPWMPIIGNHEIESGMGELGTAAYDGRYRLPNNDSRRYGGRWYAYTVGSVRFVALDAEDITLQDSGDFFIRGYSGGEQLRWLNAELTTSRASRHIDWIVVAVHHPLASSANLNGSCMGVREALLPLLSKYDVDLVLSGHDHNYERSHVLGAAEPGSATLRPRVVRRSRAENVSVDGGFVNMVIGGGGTKLPTTNYDADLLEAGAQAPVFTTEGAAVATEYEDVTWVASTDQRHAFGFAQFDVDPGPVRGGTTRMRVTQFRLERPGRPAAPADRFVLSRRRSDGPRHKRGKRP